MLSLLPLREKVDSASFLRETDEGLVDASSISSSPLIRRFTPPSPSRGEGKETRVWTQLHQHLNAKMYSIERKFVAVFSKRVASLRMSFILQKKRSTILRMA